MKKIRTAILSFILFSGFIASGCIMNKVGRIEQVAFPVQRINTRDISISKVYVSQNGGRTEIAGKVKRRNLSPFGQGHVDIAVVTSSGEIIKEISTSYTPEIIPRTGSREAFFRVRLHMTPPAGSKIIVSYHQGRRFGNNIFDCGNNVAAPGTKSKGK